MTIAIIGAGMAGLSAATALVAKGRDVAVFDKGRGPGGRMSTRRAETPLGQARFDHGAQYFTARDPAFVATVEGWVASGCVADWAGRFVEIDNQGDVSAASSYPRYVGVPGMNGVIRAMAEPLDVNWGVRVSDIVHDGAIWTLKFEDGDVKAGFEAVIIATPSEQAREILERHPELFTDDGLDRALLSARDSDPCWAGMMAFDAPVDLPWDGAKIAGGGLSWVARNSSKPKRGGPETWVLHASPAWSKAHLEEDKDAVATQLLSAFRALGVRAEPSYMAAHRWRYAQVVQGQASQAAWSEAHNIGVCGDWMMASRIENAWLSGAALAEMIVS